MAENHVRSRNLCRFGPLILALMHASSCVLQTVVHAEESRSSILTSESIVWTAIILSPTLLLILVRRTCWLLAVMAVPIVLIFLGRLHFGGLLLQSKSLPQMGDWAIWLNHLFALISLGIFFVWTLVQLIIRLAIAFSRLFG